MATAKVNESAVRVIARRMAQEALKRMALKQGHEWLEGDTPWLDFLMKLFEQLIPILVGCLGPASLGQFKQPGRLARARLKLAIRWELGDRDSIREWADPVYDAMLAVSPNVNEADVQSMLAPDDGSVFNPE